MLSFKTRARYALRACKEQAAKLARFLSESADLSSAGQCHLHDMSVEDGDPGHASGGSGAAADGCCCCCF